VEDELPEGHLNSLWPLLSEYLKRERRFIIGSEELKEGIALLPEILERASLAVRADQEWFRARVGCHTNSSGESIPFEKQEMGAHWLKSDLGREHLSPSGHSVHWKKWSWLT
jgi:hypothetical protein